MGRNSPARVKTPRCTRTGLLRFFLIDALINPRATRIEKMQFSDAAAHAPRKLFISQIIFLGDTKFSLVLFVSKFIFFFFFFFFFFFLGGG